MKKKKRKFDLPYYEAAQTDIPMIAALENLCFTDPWTDQGINLFLHEKGVRILVWGEGNRLSGYIIGRILGDEAEILRVGVLPYIRRFGMGRILVHSLVEDFARQGAQYFYLEVRESNQAAIKMYQNCGFEQQGKRPKYYQNPIEDALIMCLEVEPQTLPLDSTANSLYNETHKEDVQMFCNICGKELGTKEDYLHIKKEWGYFSKKDLEIHELRICEKCYDRLREQFSIPVSISEKTEL